MGQGEQERKRRPYLDGMIQEDAVHSFSDGIHTAKGERKVGQTSANPGSGKSSLKRGKQTSKQTSKQQEKSQ